MDQEHRPTIPWTPHHKHCLARRPRRIAARRCRSPPCGRALTIIHGARRLLRRRATTTAGRAPAARSRRVAFATTTTAAPPRTRPATGGTRRARRTTAGSPRATAASAVAGRGPGRRSTPAPRQGHAVHSLSRGTDDLREPFDARVSWRREEPPRCKRRTRRPSNGDVDPRRARGHDVSIAGRVDDGPRPRRRRRLLRDRVASHGRGKVGVEHAADALSWTHESTPPSSPGSAGCATAATRRRLLRGRAASEGGGALH